MLRARPLLRGCEVTGSTKGLARSHPITPAPNGSAGTSWYERSSPPSLIERPRSGASSHRRCPVGTFRAPAALSIVGNCVAANQVSLRPASLTTPTDSKGLKQRLHGSTVERRICTCRRVHLDISLRDGPRTASAVDRNGRPAAAVLVAEANQQCFAVALDSHSMARVVLLVQAAHGSVVGRSVGDEGRPSTTRAARSVHRTAASIGHVAIHSSGIGAAAPTGSVPLPRLASVQSP